MPKCYDTDGLNYDIFGKVTYFYSYFYLGSWKSYNYTYSDFCYNTTLYEYYCQDSSLRASAYKCPNGCKNGACINITCVDNDGMDINTKGIVSFYNGTYYNFTDVCSSPNYVYERYCENNVPKGNNLLCSLGCSNGACVKKAVNFCNDSDGGINYETKGITINETSVSEDTCISGKMLNEYYCMNNKTASFQFNCPFMCAEGACINQTNITVKVISPPSYINTSIPAFLNITLLTNVKSTCHYSVMPLYSNLTIRYYSMMSYTNSTLHFSPIVVNESGSYWLDTLCIGQTNMGTNRTSFFIVS
jgi:hypothetical protein